MENSGNKMIRSDLTSRYEQFTAIGLCQLQIGHNER